MSKPAADFRSASRQGSGKNRFSFHPQHGSHLILRRSDPFAQTTVPNHRELDRGTLRAIIRQAGLSVDEFNKLL
jgi:predicted RNA binding protein YcfA (HicA-like mRNA interferase family)